jgi:Lon protease-like protein
VNEILSRSAEMRLPDELAIFPLPSAVLLPRQVIPLNIFEPRYLSMVEYSLRSGRYIGMIQPMPAGAASDPAPVYRVGCAGRITSFQETEDDRFLIQLTGVCRFRVGEEIRSEATYRSVRPDWQPFLGDLEGFPASTVDIKDLETSLRRYLESRNMKIDWSALRKLPPAHVVDFLTVNLPLDVEEKQALVELPTSRERAQMLRLTLETAVSTTGDTIQRLH